MLSLSVRALVVAALVLAAWIIWGMFAVTAVVPAIMRHLTIYPWLTAWILVLLPCAPLATWFLLRTRKP